MRSLHIISHPDFFEREEEVIIELLERYEVMMHIRKPEALESDYIQFIQQIPEAFYPRIILHSAYYLATKFDFAALHFSTSKRELVNDVLPQSLKSTSCHALAEVKSLSGEFSSCFLSPIFSSISKEGYAGDLDLEAVKGYLSQDRNIEVIALGGIDAENIRQVSAMGFDSAAVLGAVWGRCPHYGEDFNSRVEALLKAI